MKVGDMIRWEVRSGERLAVGDRLLTPQSQALILHTPFGGYVWNRPVAVVVEQDGREERVPIPQVTLMARVALLGLGCVLAGGMLVCSALKRRESNGEEV